MNFVTWTFTIIGIAVSFIPMLFGFFQYLNKRGSPKASVIKKAIYWGVGTLAILYVIGLFVWVEPDKDTGSLVFRSDPTLVEVSEDIQEIKNKLETDTPIIRNKHPYTTAEAASAGEILIIVADFEALGTLKFNISGRIYEALRNEIQINSFPNVRIAAVPEKIPRGELEAAGAIGQRYKATILIWGSYDDAGVRPSFALPLTLPVSTAYAPDLKKISIPMIDSQIAMEIGLQDKEPNALISTGRGRTFEEFPAEEHDFQKYIREELPNQMVYLSMLTISYWYFGYNRNVLAMHAINQCLDKSKIMSLKFGLKSAYVLRGRLHDLQGDAQNAYLDFTKAIELDSNFFEAYLDRAGLMVGEKNYEAATLDCKKGLTLLDTSDIYLSALYYLNCGSAYAGLQKYHKALEYYTKSIEMGGYTSEALAKAFESRARIWIIRKSYDLAISDLKAAINANPNMTILYLRISELYYNHYRDKKSTYYYLNEFVKIEKDPVAKADVQKIIEIIKCECELDSTSADYTASSKIKPELAECYYKRGLIYYEKGDYERASADFNNAIKLKPDYAAAYNERGTVFMSKGKYDRAITDFDQTIKLEPKNSKGYNNRGTAYSFKGDHDRAIPDFDRALILKPDDHEVYYNRGTTYFVKREYNLAIADFNHAIKLKPDYVSAFGNRGIAHKAKGDKDKAIADFNKVLELTNDPNDRKKVQKHLQELGMDFRKNDE